MSAEAPAAGSPAATFSRAWTDAVIGVAGLAFVGIAFLLAYLISGLFDLIGIELVRKLLQRGWFGWMLAGFAFGAAVGLLRERDALVATLQRLVMVVMGVLAPVLGAALLLFLLSIPFTGLAKLWDSSIPATPMMLLAGAGAILLANAVIGNGADDRATSRVLRIAAQILVLAVLPLAIIAAISLGQRIGQYGLTPERMWGVIAVGVAIVYGIVGWWVVAKGRNDFDDLLRPLQTKLAMGLCGWRYSWRCRFSILARSAQAPSLPGSMCATSSRRSSTGRRWRSISGRRGGARWRRSPRPDRRSSGRWRRPR